MTRRRRILLSLVATLAVVALSPLWGFEVLYHYFLPSELPTLGVGERTLASEALWLAEGGGGDGAVDALWALNFFDFKVRPKGSHAAHTVARIWLHSKEPELTKRLGGRLSEAAIGVWLTRHASKAELQHALGEWAYFGRRAYGFHEAARVFFGRDLAALSIAQTATLAGLPQSPHASDPTCSPERAVQRRGFVLKRLREEKLISEEQFAEASAEPLNALPRECPGGT